MTAAAHGTARKRITQLFVLAICIISGLFFRLLYLQLYRCDWLTDNAVDQRIRHIPIEAKRGTVYDRNGQVLGTSISSESVYAIPAEIRNVEETAAKLAALLLSDEESLKKKLKRRQAFTWLARRIDGPVAAQIKEMALPGIGVTQETRRYYPHESLAAHVLGFTGIDNQGLDGIELTFEQFLQGRQGGIVVEYDAGGHEIPQATPQYQGPTAGADIYLTLDIVIQKIVERELDRLMESTQAKAATLIAMNPRTGEILALGNRPTYNPNRFAEYPPAVWRNIAVSNAYEPGSTFKIVTAATALQTQSVTLGDRFVDNGAVEVQGHMIHCWKHGGHGAQSFQEVVQNSCNVGFVNVGLRMGADLFYQYLEMFGFAQPTNIDLPGEGKGIIIEKARVKPINIATMAIGQSIAVTPLQLLTAVSTVINDGSRLRPQIVREIRDAQGVSLRTFQPDVVATVLKPETVQAMRQVLGNVVELGTGKGAQIEGMSIGGKTGTAQKVGERGYVPGKYIASFVGFAPVEDPQIALLVIIDEPVGLYYGGQIAAPVFQAVMKDVLPYLAVQPKANRAPEAATHKTVPSVLNLTPQQANEQLKAAGFNGQVREDGSSVIDQYPKPGSRLPAGSQILLYTKTSRYGQAEVTIPDLTGQTLLQTVEYLADLGLRLSPVGHGVKAIRQSPAAGDKVLTGSTVTVWFE